MTYIIAEPCVDVKDAACVDVCPVDCIYVADEDSPNHYDPEVKNAPGHALHPPRRVHRLRRMRARMPRHRHLRRGRHTPRVGQIHRPQLRVLRHTQVTWTVVPAHAGTQSPRNLLSPRRERIESLPRTRYGVRVIPFPSQTVRPGAEQTARAVLMSHYADVGADPRVRPPRLRHTTRHPVQYPREHKMRC